MKLKTRLVLLLGIMLLASLAGLGVMHTIHRAEEEDAHAYQRLPTESLLNQLIPLLEYPLEQFTRDHSLWDEMVGFVANPTPDWARINIDPSLTTFRLVGTWILSPDGHVHSARESKAAALPRLPGPDGQLQQVRGLLNDTIREARGFISGLDTGSTEGQPFSTTVQALVESMSWIRQTDTAVEIEDLAAQALPQQSLEKALQIVREALSNSLRHSQASRITATLNNNAGAATLAFADNGTGFDPAQKSSGGHGLGNIAERALAIGGRATIDPAPGKGTCVKIVFAPTPAS